MFSIYIIVDIYHFTYRRVKESSFDILLKKLVFREVI